jgi:hypothetical protein
VSKSLRSSASEQVKGQSALSHGKERHYGGRNSLGRTRMDDLPATFVAPGSSHGTRTLRAGIVSGSRTRTILAVAATACGSSSPKTAVPAEGDDTAAACKALAAWENGSGTDTSTRASYASYASNCSSSGDSSDSHAGTRPPEVRNTMTPIPSSPRSRGPSPPASTGSHPSPGFSGRSS